jgi:hypothetical protein
VLYNRLGLTKLSEECRRWLEALEAERIKAINRVHGSANMEQRNIERQRKREGITLCQCLSQMVKSHHKESSDSIQMDSRSIMRISPITPLRRNFVCPSDD